MLMYLLKKLYHIIRYKNANKLYTTLELFYNLKSNSEEATHKVHYYLRTKGFKKKSVIFTLRPRYGISTKFYNVFKKEVLYIYDGVELTQLSRIKNPHNPLKNYANIDSKFKTRVMISMRCKNKYSYQQKGKQLKAYCTWRKGVLYCTMDVLPVQYRHVVIAHNDMYLLQEVVDHINNQNYKQGEQS